MKSNELAPRKSFTKAGLLDMVAEWQQVEDGFAEANGGTRKVRLLTAKEARNADEYVCFVTEENGEVTRHLVCRYDRFTQETEITDYENVTED